ncbi:MAG: hypothetical protein JO170_25035 [Verrucomicrobia bacterium]|nr:hypothetical protein [Verrucomicrobiota bacterium]
MPKDSYKKVAVVGKLFIDAVLSRRPGARNRVEFPHAGLKNKSMSLRETPVPLMDNLQC